MLKLNHRKALLDAGLATFHRHGYHASGVQDVVSTAAVQKGSFDDQFESKDALGLAVLSRYRDERADVRTVLEDSTLSGLDRLKRYLSDFGYNEKGCLIGNFTAELNASFDVGEGLDHSDPLVAKAQGWTRKHFRQSIRLPDLARQLGTSERTLNRRFNGVTGAPPLRYLQSVRIEAARASLETRRYSVDSICPQVGYGDVSTFSQLFRREVGLSPHEYQRRLGRSMHSQTSV